MIFFKKSRYRDTKLNRYDFDKNLKIFLKLKKKKKIILGVTVGRSGLKWVLEILKSHKNFEGGGERNANTESFFRFAQYNNLNIDQTPLLNNIIFETLVDWEKNDISFQLSPYFSHSLNFLIKNLEPDGIIWGINEPFFTLQSFFNKNWYKENLYLKKEKKKKYGLSLTDDVRINHFFGRLAPRGNYFYKWLKFTRVGKIAWFINETTLSIFKHLKNYPKDKLFYFILNKDDQNYNFYLKLSSWLNIDKKLRQKDFLKIKFKNDTGYHKSENRKLTLSRNEKKEFILLTRDYTKIYKEILRKKDKF